MMDRCVKSSRNRTQENVSNDASFIAVICGTESFFVVGVDASPRLCCPTDFVSLQIRPRRTRGQVTRLAFDHGRTSTCQFSVLHGTHTKGRLIADLSFFGCDSLFQQ